MFKFYVYVMLWSVLSLGLSGCGVESKEAGSPGGGGGADTQDDNPFRNGSCVVAGPPCDLSEWIVSIHAVAPEGMTGNFYSGPAECRVRPEGGGGYECPLMCENANECTIRINKLEQEVVFTSPNRLFITPPFINAKEVENGDVIEVNWDEEGSWALAPNGKYRSTWDRQIVNVRTMIQNGKIMFSMDDWTVQIMGNKFFGEDAGATLEGSVEDDLSRIDFKVITANVEEVTLTRME